MNVECGIEIIGRVITGKGEGRKLGFPTANLSLESAPGIDFGVYAARVYHNGEWLSAIVNVGAHPTLPEGPPSVETYIIDKTLNLRGTELRLVLDRYIRNEKNFESVDALKEQIARDVEFVRHLKSGKL